MMARARGRLVVPTSATLTGVDPKAVATVKDASLERALMMMNRLQRNDEPHRTVQSVQSGLSGNRG